MNKQALAATVLAVCLAAWVTAQEQGESLPAGAPAGTPATAGAPPATDARHYSYAIGMDIGANFRGDALELDVESLMAGVRDGLGGAEPRYAPDLCRAAVQKLTADRAEGLRRRNEAFLAENAKQPGVETTASGLQYRVLKSGNGATPTRTDRVRVHYLGRLIDGTEFDSSLGGEPATLDVAGVIPGWTEALTAMKVGDKWELVIPAKLAYAEMGAGDVIPPNATLVFEVELLGVE